MTPEEKAYCLAVQHQAHHLAALFGAIAQETGPDSLAGKLARKGGVAALTLCNGAGDRILGAEHAEEIAEGYDLASLATTPPATIND